VEVVLSQAHVAALVRPGAERLVRKQKATRRQHPHLRQGADQTEGGVGRGVVDAHRAVSHGLAQALTVGLGVDVDDAVAELIRSVAHRGEHQVGLGTVTWAPSEHRAGLDWYAA
jgi:hypothetical protein